VEASPAGGGIFVLFEDREGTEPHAVGTGRTVKGASPLATAEALAPRPPRLRSRW
jgi:hypothetical protein